MKAFAQATLILNSTPMDKVRYSPHLIAIADNVRIALTRESERESAEPVFWIFSALVANVWKRYY